MKEYLLFMCQLYKAMYTEYMMDSQRYTRNEMQSFKLPCTVTAINKENLIIDVPDALLYFDNQYNPTRTKKARQELIKKYNGHFSVLFQRLFRKYVNKNYIVQETSKAERDDPLVYFYVPEGNKPAPRPKSKRQATAKSQYNLRSKKKTVQNKTKNKKSLISECRTTLWRH